VTTAPEPQVGDLVQEEPDGPELVVTDLKHGQPVVRPLHGGREWPARDRDALTVVAQRGTWGGLPGSGPLR
jgi:hypothetical protein